MSAALRARRFDEPGTALDEVGEATAIARLTGDRVAPLLGGVLVGPGDDAAVWQPPPRRAVVVSQDALVEGEDFRRDWITPYQLGRRCLAVAVSDLAAMGATPAWCTVTLCAPANTVLDDVLAVALGLREAGEELGCHLVGGDLSGIRGPLVVDVCVGGSIDPARTLRRDAGRVGDVLAVTGCVGAAAAGLRVLLDGSTAGAPQGKVAAWVGAQLCPRPRIVEGRHFVALGVRCAGDLSDGLLVDAGRTAAASGCRAELRIDRLPLAPGLREAFPDTWQELAVGGGEDFELLIAAPQDLFDRIAGGWPPDLAPLTPVGLLREGSGVALLDGARSLPLPRVLSRHFE